MQNSVDVLVGKRVRMRRLELSLSQSELAEKIGVTFQQVQKYERGTNRISCSRSRSRGCGADRKPRSNSACCAGSRVMQVRERPMRGSVADS